MKMVKNMKKMKRMLMIILMTSVLVPADCGWVGISQTSRSHN